MCWLTRSLKVRKKGDSGGGVVDVVNGRGIYGVHVASGEYACTTPAKLMEKRIYNGKPCGPKERLYHVQITNKDDKFYCGGSLISDQWILTAAHCWEWGMKVVLGVHPDPSKGIPVTIEAPPVMFGYKQNRIHDIMLLKLPKPVTGFQTVNFPECGKKPKTGDEVQVAGHTTTNSKPGDKKGVTVSTVVDLQKRITGGQTCGRNERLYHVQITDANNNFICGGSLISDQWILTAAHCWMWGLNVVLGVHPGPGQSVKIEAPPVMFGYKQNRIHDIMLLKLPKPLSKINPALTNIQPVSLPDCGRKPRTGDIVQIAGHAATNQHIAGPGFTGLVRVYAESYTLQCANIPVVGCPRGFMSAYEHTFCGHAGTGDADACHGDSGGGVVYNGKIYGVISRGGHNVCVRPVGFMDVCVTVSTVVDLQKRIFGGQICGPNERQYHVKLTDVNNNLICGGSLISNQWILTAAHCWEDGQTMKALLRVHPLNSQVEQHIIQDHVIFTDKDAKGNKKMHDIMLLKLPTPTNIKPVKLPDCRNRPNRGATVRVAGFADRNQVNGVSNTLQCADFTVVDCPWIRKPSLDSIRYQCQHVFCGRTPGVDTCPGDSGGGVVKNDMIYGVHVASGEYVCTTPAAFMECCDPSMMYHNLITRYGKSICFHSQIWTSLEKSVDFKISRIYYYMGGSSSVCGDLAWEPEGRRFTKSLPHKGDSGGGVVDVVNDRGIYGVHVASGVTVSTVVDLQKRITGGQTCGNDERLYHVQITDANNNFICGGSLISDQWILTAAHCWMWGLNVVLGVHPGPGQSVKIEAPPVMFGYKQNRIHDIMLLKLPKPLSKINPALTNIQPVSLPDCGRKPRTGDIVQIAGHAATNQHIWSQVGVTGSVRGTTKGQGDSGGGVVYNGKIYGVITDGGPNVFLMSSVLIYNVKNNKENKEKPLNEKCEHLRPSIIEGDSCELTEDSLLLS
ncbi:hypothetical protein L3Q82_005490 [Scortum barcoo]|uniref:Uncharacterized protein n=1 Tax=Scortum barcoo TaxID=214431 RepID=A0ACB8VAK8_9TELE|nr:hypothetical protein L3Q82_005490 [Scortum barcoo]